MQKIFKNHDNNHYDSFTSQQWENFLSHIPLTVPKESIERLMSFNSLIDVDEIWKIFLPLSRLMFTNATKTKTPFIIGIAGSVAVGKSTIARILYELLQQWSSNPKVELISTDGFLFPNTILKKKNLMHRKGFPESYQLNKLLIFLSDIKNRKKYVYAPRYSHSKYDIIDGEFDTLTETDILILEGINVLQKNHMLENEKKTPIVSDFCNFSIYINAEEDLIQKWYTNRSLTLRKMAFANPMSYFYRFTQMSEYQYQKNVTKIWRDINLPNLIQNILPTRKRADLIINKGEDHFVKTIELKKL
ncbi:MAG: type I pantothenate kinase [Candidatus Liberibacter ctenarytainae]|uniref:Pantothenate kinase n=1 Tax=Candidatus Liberibacter ctenarytainae TaxID=2020335 RepID=A0A937ABM3_9HYPH|nr:type I pantothenate kinase [Candidatus Liberibacter ctenarytainae]